MECIVLAGGLGTRLRSVVSNLPKCMAPIAGNPFLYYIFKYLECQKIEHIILSVGHKYEAIEEWVQQNTWPVQISYAIEKEPLGTGGAIKLALTQAKEEQVFVINGDTFFEVDLNALYFDHIEVNADLSVALKPMEKFERYGNVVLDKENRIISFMEKQYCKKGQINGGTYIINRDGSLLNGLGLKFSFETEVLQKRFTDHYFYGKLYDGYFIDIGIPEDFNKANVEFKTMFL